MGEKRSIFFEKGIKKPCQILLLDRDKTKNKHYEQTLSKTQFNFKSHKYQLVHQEAANVIVSLTLGKRKF